MVFAYGAASWSRDGLERSGYTVRIWQRRTEGWKLVFDELLGSPPKKSAQ